MHVTLIAPTAVPKSGWGVLASNYASALFEKGVPFDLLLPHSAAVPDAPFASRVRRILPDLPLSFRGPSAFFKSLRIFKSLPYSLPSGSVVHSLVDFPYAALGYRLARRHGARFFFNAIGTYSTAPFRHFPDRQVALSAYRGAERIFAISEYTKKRMMEAAGYVRQVDVLRLPVVRPVPAGAEDRSVFRRLPAGKRYILTVSSPRIGGRKGFDSLFAAFASVYAAMPDIHLVAVGGMPARTAMHTVLPEVSPAELGALYGECVFFAAMPRATGDFFEGYGLVYREAGLYGKSVIGTFSGGVPEAVENGVTGLLVPENDVSAMVAALSRLLADGQLAARLGAAGREKASLRTWADYAEQTLSSYEEA